MDVEAHLLGKSVRYLYQLAHEIHLFKKVLLSKTPEGLPSIGEKKAGRCHTVPSAYLPSSPLRKKVVGTVVGLRISSEGRVGFEARCLRKMSMAFALSPDGTPVVWPFRSS